MSLHDLIRKGHSLGRPALINLQDIESSTTSPDATREATFSNQDFHRPGQVQVSEFQVMNTAEILAIASWLGHRVPQRSRAFPNSCRKGDTNMPQGPQSQLARTQSSVVNESTELTDAEVIPVIASR